MYTIETERLDLRGMTEDDAEFILELLNQPAFLRFIGDKGVRTVADARRYILEGPVASYLRNGFGLLLVELKKDGTPIGMCGLLKRDSLEDVDIGCAFLPAYVSRGYAFEAADAVMRHGHDELGIERIVAIVSPDNERSIRLLGKLGMRFDRMLPLSPDGRETMLFVPRKEV